MFCASWSQSNAKSNLIKSQPLNTIFLVVCEVDCVTLTPAFLLPIETTLPDPCLPLNLTLLNVTTFAWSTKNVSASSV